MHDRRVHLTHPKLRPKTPPQATPQATPQVPGARRGHTVMTATSILGCEASAQLTARLLAELTNLTNGNDAALWAQRCLPEKNKLTAADALRVEDAFQARLAGFVAPLPQDPSAPGQTHLARPSRKWRAASAEKQRRSKAVDKVTLTIPEPRRIRDREHVKYVASQPCLVCGRMPCDAHHLRFAQPRALGRKVSDEFTVPLCRGHHSEVHRSGNEAAWWQKAGIDPTLMARALWLGNHPLRNAVAPSSAVST